MVHGNKLVVAVVHKVQPMPVAVGMFRQLLDAHMGMDLILACMESSVKNQAAAIGTLPLHYQLQTVL